MATKRESNIGDSKGTIVKVMAKNESRPKGSVRLSGRALKMVKAMFEEKQELKNAFIKERDKADTFNRKNKKKINPKPKNELTPLERKLFNFCKKRDIDLSKSKGNSIDKIHYEAEALGFKNLKGKKKLVRSTVGKMLAKIRP